MAISSLFIKFSGPFLFVVILQAAKISALNCYGCVWDPEQSIQLVNKECTMGNPPDKFLVNDTKSHAELQEIVDEILEEFVDEEYKMSKGPYCAKWLIKDEGTEHIFRYIMDEAPDGSYLDEFGCITDEQVRMCFCKEDKCNNGPIVPPTSEIATTSGPSERYQIWPFNLEFISLRGGERKVACAWVPN